MEGVEKMFAFNEKLAISEMVRDKAKGCYNH